MTDKDRPSSRGGDKVDVWYNASALPIDLSDGRVLAPGQIVRESIAMNPHNKYHNDVGSLVQLTREEADRLPKEGEVTDG